MRRVSWLLLAGVGFACAPADSVLVGRELRVVAADPFALAQQQATGLAIVWAGFNAASVSDDVPFSWQSGEANLFFDPEAITVTALLAPEEEVGVRDTTATVYRPRIVLYEDTDGSGAFEPPTQVMSSADAVLAIDDIDSLAALLDLEGFLRAASSADVDRYYELTAHEFTPFVRVAERPVLVTVSGMPPVALRVTAPRLAAEDLVCHRTVARQFPDPARTVYVDDELDPAATCTTSSAACVPEDLAARAQPPIDTIVTRDQARTAWCRTNGVLDALLVFSSADTCAACVCLTQEVVDAFVTRTASPPPWWPCPNLLPYCASETPLTEFDLNCVSL